MKRNLPRIIHSSTSAILVYWVILIGNFQILLFDPTAQKTCCIIKQISGIDNPRLACKIYILTGIHQIK